MKHRHVEWALQIASSQDKTAFTALFDFFAPRLNHYLCRLGADAQLAEDIVQETMTRLWHKAALFDPKKSSLSTWLFRIARNRYIDIMRQRKEHVSDDVLETHEDEATSSPELHTIQQQNIQAIQAALKDLPDAQMELIQLAFFGDYSHAAIAEKTGLPLGTIKSRIRLAFKKLRTTLEEHPP